MSRVRAFALAFAVILVAGACRVDATVEIAVNDDGSGLVTASVVMDAAAVAQSPDLPDGLRLDDLTAAGWTVVDPTRTTDGGLAVTAQKPFASASQLPVILAEIAGEGVVFDGITLTQRRSFARTTYEITGSVDPSPDIESFGDDGLAQALQGAPLGRSPAELEREVGALSEALGLELRVSLPDDITTDETASVDGATATWTFDYGDAPLDLAATGTVEDSVPRIWAGVAIGALALLFLVLLLRGLRWVIAILRTPKGRRRRDIRRRQHRAATREAEASRPRRRLLRLLVVDVHGVIVRPTEPVEGLLLPIIRAEQPDIDPDFVRDRHRRLVLGRITNDEFWSDVGLGPVAGDIETRYLSSFRLVPGLHAFLDRMAERRLPVAVVGNDPRAWGERLRRMASLEDAVASWLVSGDVGAVLPDPPLFEATRRTLSVDLYDVLYLSSVEGNLDAGEQLGMATAYFAAGPGDVIETHHTLVRGFDDLLRGRS